MKKIYIVAIVMVAVAIGLLTSAADDMSTYATFEDAATNGERVKIAGQLAKDKEMYYNPEEDPNYFSFYIRDAEGEERKVVLLSEKPQDFELSEQIVLTGSMKGDEFVATDMLMKCPSKYKDEEVYIKSEASKS
ncbi:MAG: cytochrome c maturation protein CcmE [Bacteroidetes bacterium]|jgi:cytochrome c-type biogenesis protein CcmE|nr:cytochrome c maturation protein CcmE [Bacteroidota bacterium]